jgi:hypothetical protein
MAPDEPSVAIKLGVFEAKAGGSDIGILQDECVPSRVDRKGHRDPSKNG